MLTGKGVSTNISKTLKKKKAEALVSFVLRMVITASGGWYSAG